MFKLNQELKRLNLKPVFNQKQKPNFLLIISMIFIVAVLTFSFKKFILRQILYPAPAVSVNNPPQPLEEIILIQQENKIYAWSFIEKQSNSPILVYFHGNGENLTTMHHSGLFKSLIKLRLNFIAPDYPGYGKSGGSSNEQDIIEAAIEAVTWAKKFHPKKPVILCGWSLGAAVAVQAAEKMAGEISGLIILSPWNSLREVARHHFPGWMVNFLLNESYNSGLLAESIKLPTLILHGQNDELIPLEQGRKLNRNFTNSTLIEFPEGHNDLLGNPEVWKQIENFIEKVLNQ